MTSPFSVHVPGMVYWVSISEHLYPLDMLKQSDVLYFSLPRKAEKIPCCPVFPTRSQYCLVTRRLVITCLMERHYS